MNFCFEGGVASFVRHLNKGRNTLSPRPIYIEKTVETTQVEAALQYNDGFSAGRIQFREHDQHDRRRRAPDRLSRGADARAERATRASRSSSRTTTRTSPATTCARGWSRSISVKLPEPQFEGQTKTRLGNAEVETARAGARSSEALMQYLEEHPTDGRRIIEKGIMASRAREAARKARDLVVRKGAARRARCCPASWPTAPSASRTSASCTSSRETAPAARRRAAATGASRRSCRCAARS